MANSKRMTNEQISEIFSKQLGRGELRVLSEKDVPIQAVMQASFSMNPMTEASREARVSNIDGAIAVLEIAKEARTPAEADQLIEQAELMLQRNRNMRMHEVYQLMPRQQVQPYHSLDDAMGARNRAAAAAEHAMASCCTPPGTQSVPTEEGDSSDPVKVFLDTMNRVFEGNQGALTKLYESREKLKPAIKERVVKLMNRMHSIGVSGESAEQVSFAINSDLIALLKEIHGK